MPYYICEKCGDVTYSAAHGRLTPCALCGGPVRQEDQAMANHKPVRDLDEAIARCERELQEYRRDRPHKPTREELEDMYRDPEHDFGNGRGVKL